MEGSGKNQNGKKMVGESNYLNKNCWLIKNLNYAPYKRCQYCELKFRNCLFLQYQVVSLFLILLFLSLFILIERELPLLAIITVFTLIIVYGYFFNRSTENIIKANFFLKKTKEALKKLADNLKEKVDEQTKEIRKKSEHLQELLKMKTDFLRVVNHQLNTPLSIMRNAILMLAEGSIAQDKAIKIAKSGLERLSDTLDDFWRAFALEGEEIKMEKKKVDISEIVKKIVEEKKQLSLVLERNLKLNIKRPKFKLPLVFCNPQEITHVISNLLDNAVFYTPKGKILVFFSLPQNNFLQINIKDSGVGINQEDKEKLFQKFSRGKNAALLKSNGSGLGLYIARRLVEIQGGKIFVESEGENKGSTFSFTLPVHLK